jgi:phage N-6-adenine-methyltransferase
MGRPRKYTTNAHRQKAYRKRLKRSILFSSQWSNCETPQSLFNDLDREFHFTLDVCALPYNAKCAHYYTPDKDGLRQPWGGQVCWLNPPYGRAIGLWVAKAYQEALGGATVVALLPPRTDTAWWHQYIAKAADVRFIKGRLKFSNATNSAPFPTGRRSFQKDRSPVSSTDSLELA